MPAHLDYQKTTKKNQVDQGIDYSQFDPNVTKNISGGYQTQQYQQNPQYQRFQQYLQDSGARGSIGPRSYSGPRGYSGPGSFADTGIVGPYEPGGGRIHGEPGDLPTIDPNKDLYDKFGLGGAYDRTKAFDVGVDVPDVDLGEGLDYLKTYDPSKNILDEGAGFGDVVDTGEAAAYDPTAALDVRQQKKEAAAAYDPTAALDIRQQKKDEAAAELAAPKPDDLQFGDKELQDLVTQQVKDDLSGEGAEIKSLHNTYERDVARMRADGMAEARAIAAERGYTPGTEQYNQVMRNSMKEINDASLKAQRNLFSAIRTKRQQALQTGIDFQDQLFGQGESIWKAMNTDEKNTQAELDKLISGIPHQGIKNILSTWDPNDVTGAREWLKSITDPKTGKPKDQYFDAPYDIISSKAADMLRAEYGDIAAKYTDADGNFDAEAFKKDPVIQPLIGKQTAELLEAEFAPVTAATETAVAKEERTARIEAFIADGDYTKMAKGDWASMTETQKTEAQKHISIFEDKPFKESWKEDDSISTADATAQWNAAHGYTKGDLVEKGGVLYVITETAKVSSSTQWETYYGVPSRQTRNKLQLVGRPVDGGAAVVLDKTTEFDPD